MQIQDLLQPFHVHYTGKFRVDLPRDNKWSSTIQSSRKSTCKNISYLGLNIAHSMFGKQSWENVPGKHGYVRRHLTCHMWNTLNLIVITLEKGISQFLEALSDGSAVQYSMKRGCRTTSKPHMLHISSKSCCWLTVITTLELLSASSTGCTSCL